VQVLGRQLRLLGLKLAGLLTLLALALSARLLLQSAAHALQQCAIREPAGNGFGLVQALQHAWWTGEAMCCKPC
jgi:hypothetical protein